MSRDEPRVDGDPYWYRDAVVYELHVRAFFDTTGDGVGDFRGLAEKLDYLKDLGVNALWLLPFYPSPLRDDGYDISDYTSVHPAYGTLAEVRHLLREAHARGLRVITELVLNHTSDQHPWFQRARRAPRGTPHRDFYVWSDTPEKYRDARIVFKDFEQSNWSWDPGAGAYYWHRFYAHQPDLNWDNPAVWKAMLRVLDFWLEMGVDGLRLDAVPYLYEREGTSCENLPETHATLKALRRHVDRKFAHRVLLAEANQWPEDAAAYFGTGDESHLAFHFPLMPRLFMALHLEDRYPLIDILSQTPAIPEGGQWALFLRNHDELTLEMVTDEERDYMYRVYAKDPQARINLGIRRRLAPLLGNDRRRIELMTALLLSLPGTPVLYYGDEIGMGDNIFLGDRNGVRTPMQWTADRNAGFSRANPQRLYLPVIIDPDYSYEAVNVQSQLDNPHSLLWWTRRIIAQRQRFRAFGRGTLEFLYPANRKVLAFVRRYEGETVLVVANLSRHAQFVELDLSAARESVPVEMFGGSTFPPVGESPYRLTLGPHSFYWFELRATRASSETAAPGARAELPRLRTRVGWANFFRKGAPKALEELLLPFLATRPGVAGSGRALRRVEITGAVPVSAAVVAHLVLVRVEYAEGDPETHLLPLVFAVGERAGRIRAEHPHDLVAVLEAGGEEGVLYCAGRDEAFGRALLMAIERRRRLRGPEGEIVAERAASYGELRGGLAAEQLPARANGAQDGAFVYGDRLALKLFHRVEGGSHPAIEVGTFLTETASFPHALPVAGRLEYRPTVGETAVLAVLHGLVPNEGDAGQLASDSVGRYLEVVVAQRSRLGDAPLPALPLLDLSLGDSTSLVQQLLGDFLEPARLLGQRVAELHLALASHPEDPAFAPEPFTPFYRRSLYQSMRNLTQEASDLLGRHLASLPPGAREDAEKVRGLQGEILKRLRSVLDRPFAAVRMRTHGELRLEHVLWTGRDFTIVDFDGGAGQPLSARRLKRSPLRDVASMVHSFHAAGAEGLSRHVERGGVSAEASTALESWAHYWSIWASSAFLKAYLRVSEPASLLPRDREDLGGLLFVYLLEDVLQALGRDLVSRSGSPRLLLREVQRVIETER